MKRLSFALKLAPEFFDVEDAVAAAEQLEKMPALHHWCADLLAVNILGPFAPRHFRPGKRTRDRQLRRYTVS